MNYTLSVSEYVTTNVTVKPVTFLHGTNHGCTVVCNTLTVSRKKLSNSIPHRVKSRTEAVKHLSRCLRTWKMLKIILSKLKFINYQNQWFHTWLCFNINLAMYSLPSNMNSSSHKAWQTSLLFLKPLQIQNLKRKNEGGHFILCPPRLKKWEDTGACPPPNCAHAYLISGPTIFDFPRSIFNHLYNKIVCAQQNTHSIHI